MSNSRIRALAAKTANQLDGTEFIVTDKTGDASATKTTLVEFLIYIAAQLEFPSGDWGSIGGNLSDQVDLQAALDGLQSDIDLTQLELGTGLALKQSLANSSTALVDAATMDLTAIKHTLTTAAAARTFSISYTGDVIRIWVILNAVSSVLTFPATALCVSDGLSSGNNTCTLSGVSGDKYLIEVYKEGLNYTVLAKNLGQ